MKRQEATDELVTCPKETGLCQTKTAQLATGLLGRGLSLCTVHRVRKGVATPDRWAQRAREELGAGDARWGN